MSINLLPWREALYQKHKKRVLLEGGIGLVLVFLFFCVTDMREKSILEKQYGQYLQLEEAVDSLKESYEVALEEKDRRDELSKKENFLKTKSKTNLALLDHIEQISDQMPNTMYLTAFKKQDKKIYFFGKASSHVEISNFLTRVKLRVKKQPMIAETSQVDSQNDEIDFEIGYEF